jgi:hypothetical protein
MTFWVLLCDILVIESMTCWVVVVSAIAVEMWVSYPAYSFKEWFDRRVHRREDKQSAVIHFIRKGREKARGVSLTAETRESDDAADAGPVNDENRYQYVVIIEAVTARHYESC